MVARVGGNWGEAGAWGEAGGRTWGHVVGGGMLRGGRGVHGGLMLTNAGDLHVLEW